MDCVKEHSLLNLSDGDRHHGEYDQLRARHEIAETTTTSWMDPIKPINIGNNHMLKLHSKATWMWR